MSIPDFDSDVSPYNLRFNPNHSDDDAEVLDNLVEQDATPPEPAELPRVELPPVPKAALPAKRIIRFRAIAVDRNVSMLLLPENPYRVKAVISSNVAITYSIQAVPAVPTITAPGEMYLSAMSPSATLELTTTSAVYISQYSRPVGEPPLVTIMEEITEEPGR